MAIAPANRINDITANNERLLGRTPDGKAVIQKVQRILPRWKGVSTNGELEAEAIYKINAGVTDVTLRSQAGLFQMLNSSGAAVTITAAFNDGTTSFILEPGMFLQSEGYIDGADYKYTRIATALGGASPSTPTTNPTTPPDSTNYVPPATPNNLAGGNYKLVSGQTYTQQAPSTITALPVTWFYWLDGNPGDVATVKLNAATDGIPVLFKDTSSWVSSNTNPDIHINADEAIAVTLRQITPAEQTSATSALGAFTATRIYEIATIWRQSTIAQPTIKNKFGATSAPTATNDISEGYTNGSVWNWGDRVWVLVDSADNNAKWIELTDTSPIVTGAVPNATNIFNTPTLAVGSSLPAGVWAIRSNEIWQYSGIPEQDVLPKRWVFWNVSETGTATLSVSYENDQIITHNVTNDTGGATMQQAAIAVAAGEVWEIEVRSLTETERTFYANKFNLPTPPITIRLATRIFAGAAPVLDNFGNWTVIRVAQDIDTSGFKPLTLYLLDNLGLGSFRVLAGDRILTEKGSDYAGGTTITINNKNYKSITLPNAKSQYFAYRVGNNLIIWQVAASAGIPTGDALPSDTAVGVFHLVNHASLPDGLYSRDRNNDWVI